MNLMTQFLPPTTSMIHFYKKHVSTDKTERQSFRFDALKNYFTGPDDPNYLWRIRRQAEKAGAGEDYRRIERYCVPKITGRI